MSDQNAFSPIGARLKDGEAGELDTAVTLDIQTSPNAPTSKVIFMDTNPLQTRCDPLSHVIGEMAHALGDRPNGTAPQRARRIEMAHDTIIAFRPADAIEAMIAGHCVMFHELIVDSVQDTPRGEAAAVRRQHRSNIVAMDKAFGNNLARLNDYRARYAEVAPDASATPSCAETDIAERIRRHVAPLSDRPLPEAARTPFPRPVAVAQAKSELPAAAGTVDPTGFDPDGADPSQFAKVMSVRPPDESVLRGASASVVGLGASEAADRQPQSHAYAGNRQARRLAARNGQAMNATAAG